MGTINTLHDQLGNLITKPCDIKAVNFFQELLDGRMVIAKDFIDFCVPVDDQEIPHALSSISNEYAPILDGIGPKVFKDAWNLIGEDFTRSIKDFFSSYKLPQGMNATAIWYIPEIPCPNTPADFTLADLI
ncbi:OLC1v1036217C1 [Oldenlandia corymbosa var. corymbosa]|uniref:OLC1v1036217C1 n=1 Tax=Oldenlandia corymbosa var. corymbosa TaxID=529605 RepID=A0AAV1CYA0_OLDCO|nr:OLC1v1036217C1 [Oldenlandia corymbosa var. corymbosa]